MNLSFHDPSSYDMLEAGEPLVFELEGETISLPTIIVPVGARVHRADHKGPTTPSNRVPAFFGNRASTRVYGRNKGNSAHTSYTVKKPMHLFQMNLNSLQDLYFHPSLTEDDRKHIQLYYQRNISAVIPTLPIGRPNAEGHVPYLNRRIASIVCRLFDGWVVMPLNPEKRHGLFQYSLISKKVSVYPPEFMICKWKEFLDPVTGGSRSRTRKNSRR